MFETARNEFLINNTYSKTFDKYIDNKEIFYIIEDDECYWINGSDGYPKKDWLISDAVAHYKSEEGALERYDSEYRAWCD